LGFPNDPRIHEAVARIADEKLGLDIFPNQIEVITAEQMLDAYASAGMPLFYRHWSFGKRFAQHEGVYRAGLQGLAYEIVINSTLHKLHHGGEHRHDAGSGDRPRGIRAQSLFKNNYQFRQWTDPGSILDYLAYAKNYIANCEERYGESEVERLLDARMH